MEPTGFLHAEELAAMGFASYGENVSIDRSVRFYGAGRIALGSHIRIDAYSVISAGAGGIVIGNHVHIGVYVFLTGAARIELGDFCGISGRVSIYSSNDDYTGAALTGPTIPEQYRKVDSAPVAIGRHVVVGAGSVVLPGVTVADGACVGALSLVKRDVAAFDIVAGTSGRVVMKRKRDLLELERQLLATEND